MNVVAKPRSPEEFQNSDNPILGKLGSLEVKIASTNQEIASAIALREKVFAHASQFNHDHFDEFCDHLIVIDRSKDNETSLRNVVATYRLLDSTMAEKAGGFCAEQEFNIEPLLIKQQNLLEFGRSCVHPDYRDKRTVELLWAGSWAYVLKNSIDIMFGCASFEGANPNDHLDTLSFLHHFAPALPEYPISSSQQSLPVIELVQKDELNAKIALKKLPTIIKGYLRLGAMFSNAYAIDENFNTTDVLVIMPVSKLNPRYVNYYGADASRHAK